MTFFPQSISNNIKLNLESGDLTPLKEFELTFFLFCFRFFLEKINFSEAAIMTGHDFELSLPHPFDTKTESFRVKAIQFRNRHLG